jgi:hypothetical protein
VSQQELLKKVICALEHAGIDYMVTGSTASSLQGEPRSTHDLDLVVNLQKSAVKFLIEAFSEPDYYLDEDSIMEAIDRGSMFNLIDINDGDKVDFWMLTDDSFDQSRFSRKYIENVLDIHIQVSRPEDTILAKLKWANLSGGSEKQFVDALRVYEVQFENIDREYLETWAATLHVNALLDRLKNEAEIL